MLVNLGDFYLFTVLFLTGVWMVYFLSIYVVKNINKRCVKDTNKNGKEITDDFMRNLTYFILPMFLIPVGIFLLQVISKDNFRLEFFVSIIIMLIIEFGFSFLVLNLIKPKNTKLELFVINLLETLLQAMAIYAIVSVFLNKITEDVGKYVLFATLYVAGIVSYKFALKTYIDTRDKK